MIEPISRNVSLSEIEQPEPWAFIDPPDDFDWKWINLYNFVKGEYGDFGMSSEAYWVMQFLHERFGAQKGSGMIEIGAGFGASFHVWSQFFEGPRISIDVPISLPGDQTFRVQHRQGNWIKHFGATDLYPIVRPSQDPVTINQVEEILNGRQVDWLFIDGEHSYEAAANDFKEYNKFVRKGGYIGMHDVVNPDFASRVGKAFREIRGDKFWITQFKCAGIGIIQKT